MQIADVTVSHLRSHVIPHHGDSPGLLMNFLQLATEPFGDLVVHRSGANEEQSLVTKGLTAKNMAFVNDLRKDAFVDILPVEPCGATAGEWNAFEMGRAFGLIVTCCVDGLYFHGNETLQCPFRADVS